MQRWRQRKKCCIRSFCCSFCVWKEPSHESIWILKHDCANFLRRHLRRSLELRFNLSDLLKELLRVVVGAPVFRLLLFLFYQEGVAVFACARGSWVISLDIFQSSRHQSLIAEATMLNYTRVFLFFNQSSSWLRPKWTPNGRWLRWLLCKSSD